MIKEHSEEVVNYCIDNKVSFAMGYVELIDEKLDKLVKELADLRKDLEFAIEDAQFKH
tara:strand:- start:709 stop:882 length:174 start_codon:yes stop_codon:yes gene_type:complete